jgi:predicted permease
MRCGRSEQREGGVSGVRSFVSRVAAVFGLRDDDAELDEELRAHVEFAAEENRRRGMTDGQARTAALRSFGGVTQVRERYRMREGLPWVENLRRDVGYALRQMRRSPGFAATVIGTLALGIGAAAAMFTVVDHVLLRPVSYRDAGRLVTILVGDEQNAYGATWLDIEQWQKESRSFEQIAFSGGMGERNYLRGETALLEVSGKRVTANLFSTLGVQPELGRDFLPEGPSVAPGRNAGTIVLSDAVWRTAFGADRSIPGRTIRINDASYTVVGVMPAGFRYPAGNGATGQVWISMQLRDSDKLRNWSAGYYQVIARLRRGVTQQQAAAEVGVIQKRLSAAYTDPDAREARSGALVKRYEDTLVGVDVRRALLGLLAAAGVLWLIASVNVTNLLLARSTARQREIAMRGALGASRTRVVQQMIVEGLVLSGAAAVAGVGLAISSVKLLAHELTQRLPLPVPAMPDGWILAALLGLTFLSALMASAWPAWMAARNPIEPALRQGGMQAGTGRNHHRMRGVLVAAEVALSLTLLVGCGLLLRTIYNLHHVTLGYRTDHILVAHLSIPAYRFTGRNMTTDLYEPLLERVKPLHGVEGAGLITEVPLGNTYEIILGLRMNGNSVGAALKAASPGARMVFGFPMAAGRYFNDSDTPTSESVVVVNKAFARAFSPDRHDPKAILGQKLMATTRNPQEGEGAVIVGVMDDFRQNEVSQPSQPEMELCIPQLTPDNTFYPALDGRAMDLAVRTEQPTSQMIRELRDVLRQAHPELANSTITTMDEIVEDSYGSQRLAAQLLEIFGGAALLLCVTGLYGLLAYVVSQRTRELGVRIALGAQRGNLLWLVMRQAGGMLLAGVAAGMGLALASGRLVRGFLYGVSGHDGWALTGAAVLLLASGLLAAYLPARRAATVDPMRALRAE